MPHAYTEDQLVEQPAIGLFSVLGWQTVSAMEEGRDEAGSHIRKTSLELMVMSSMLDNMTFRIPVLKLPYPFSRIMNVEGQR